MQTDETIWLNSVDICSFEHVANVSGLQRNALLALVEAGVIEPANQAPGTDQFHTECIVVARRARKLQDDFELDVQGLVLAMNLLRRIQRLEAQLEALHARMPRF